MLLYNITGENVEIGLEKLGFSDMDLVRVMTMIFAFVMEVRFCFCALKL